MKTFRKIASLLLVVIMSVSFVSCSDDEKDEPAQPTTPTTPTTPTLVGTWIEKGSDMPFVLVLNSDYTGTISYNTTGSRALLTDHFNWSTSMTSDGDTLLRTIHTSGDIIFESINNLYILAGNELIVVFEFGGELYRADFRRQ